MKKLTLLSLLALCGFAILVYFFQHGQSNLATHHEQVLTHISYGKETDTSLEKDVLKARNFLLPSYDAIVKGEEKLQGSCEHFREKSLSLYGTSPSLDQAIDRYCDAVNEKIAHVESFKSKTAVLKNSIYYIHEIAVENPNSRDASANNLPQQLSRVSLAYYLLSSTEAERTLRTSIDGANRGGGRTNQDVALARSHSQKILDGKIEIDQLIQAITDTKVSAHLVALEKAYFREYESAASQAETFRQLMFATCVFLLALIVYSIISLWRAARDLATMNSSLEERVKIRTNELKESQDLITTQQQALAGSAKMSALGEMAGGIAHEINNPLAAIKTIASQMNELLQEPPVDFPLLIEMTAKIEKTSDRIAKIVQGLRIFSRDGSRDPFQPVRVFDLVNETTSLCRERFKSHNVNLQIDDIPDSLNFAGREIEMSQVLLNLLNNAHDAIQGLAEKWIHVSASKNGNFVEILVTDSGAGIAPEIQKKIFQPFFTTKEIGKGTGLGLSISLGIVNSHRGTLEIDPTCPHTRFILRLPSCDAGTNAA